MQCLEANGEQRVVRRDRDVCARRARKLLDETGMAAIYISHDLAEVAEIADRLAILYAGRTMEVGPAKAVFEQPRHPYAQALRRSVPTLRAETLVTGIAGTPPAGLVRDRCSFFDRCPEAADICLKPIPLVEDGDRSLRCVRAGTDTPASGAKALPAVPALASSGNALLSVGSVVCDYGRGSATVLKQISFDMAPGELVGLVGESAAASPLCCARSPGCILRAPAPSPLRARRSRRTGANVRRTSADACNWYSKIRSARSIRAALPARSSRMP